MERIVIRNEREDEYRYVEYVVREAFWNVYRPGCLEHYVLHCLRKDPDFISELDLVLQLDGIVIGQVAAMKAEIAADDGRRIPIMTFGPIGVLPAYKRQGFGKILLDEMLKKAAGLGFGAVCMEGNIDFYGKSGFSCASDYGIRYHGMPEGEMADFFLCKELIPRYLEQVTGEYSAPTGYFVDEKACEEFDRYFEPKTKMKLPGRIFE